MIVTSWIVIVALIVGGLIGYFVICKLTREKDGSAGGTTRPPYRKQAVATDNEQCSIIANETLTKNGSAVDAAIAAMFCLGVINMHSSGVGGGGVMLVYNRTLKKARVIDFRETAPMKTTTNMFEPNETGEEKSKYGLYTSSSRFELLPPPPSPKPRLGIYNLPKMKISAGKNFTFFSLHAFPLICKCFSTICYLLFL